MPIIVSAPCNGPQTPWKETQKSGNQKKNRDHSVQSTVEIKQNTKTSPGDKRNLIVTQTSMKNTEE